MPILLIYIYIYIYTFNHVLYRRIDYRHTITPLYGITLGGPQDPGPKDPGPRTRGPVPGTRDPGPWPRDPGPGAGRQGPLPEHRFIPSTSGEGSAIFQGASRSRRCRLHFCEIKISLCLLDFEGCGSLDLSEIYQFSPSKRCAFDFRHPTFAYPRANHTPGAPALRIGILRKIEYSASFRCVLHFEGCGSVDLAEIYQFSPWKRCACDFRLPTFA